MASYHFLSIFFVFVLGSLNAFSELVSRYRRPEQIFRFYSSWIYLLINGSASIFAYCIFIEYNLKIGSLLNNELGRVLLSGLSAMVVLRSSFASVKVGNKVVDVGIASIIQIFLDWADRSFDSGRSLADFKEIEEIMRDIDFKAARTDIPISCLSLMKNVPLEEQQSLVNLIQKLEGDASSNKAKSISLGALVSNVVGIPLLREVVVSFKSSILINSEDSQILNKENRITNLMAKFE